MKRNHRRVNYMLFQRTKQLWQECKQEFGILIVNKLFNQIYLFFSLVKNCFSLYRVVVFGWCAEVVCLCTFLIKISVSNIFKIILFASVIFAAIIFWRMSTPKIKHFWYDFLNSSHGVKCSFYCVFRFNDRTSYFSWSISQP